MIEEINGQKIKLKNLSDNELAIYCYFKESAKKIIDIHHNNSVVLEKCKGNVRYEFLEKMIFLQLSALDFFSDFQSFENKLKK